MCGIYASNGKKRNAGLVTFHGLRRLEYRGYDSAGVSGRNDGEMTFIKRVGKISEIPEREFSDMQANVAIGHTRWATHGGVTEANAHPHWNLTRSLSVVHNGIIENHNELRDRLKEKLGRDIFVSETDTEVIPHLIDLHLLTELSLEEAVFAAARELKGQFAFVVMNTKDHRLIAVRNQSPLLFGQGRHGRHLASDSGAFPEDVSKEIELSEGEAVSFGPDGNITFFNLKTGRKITKHSRARQAGESLDSKAPWPHFMLKETMDQTKLAQALNQDPAALAKVLALIRDADQIVLTGCGTAARVAMVGEYFFAEERQLRVEFTLASEFGRRLPYLGPKSVVIAISQSGETADTLNALRKAQERGAKVVSILNRANSTMSRLSDVCLFLNIGQERAVASTKAATAQMLILKHLALLSALKDPDMTKRRLTSDLARLTPLWESGFRASIRALARKIAGREDMFLIGRGELSAIALEGALKVQEVGYIPALGFPGGESKHGPIALVVKGMPCVAFIADDEHEGEMLSNCHELKARGGFIIGISPHRNEVFDHWIKVPKTNHLSPIASLIPLQFLAYYLSILRGNNPDTPRNLAKSVTV
jgi:glucosamine--fructose-6-phosphate aminotransferase (isomerizing)